MRQGLSSQPLKQRKPISVAASPSPLTMPGLHNMALAMASGGATLLLLLAGASALPGPPLRAPVLADPPAAR